MSTVPSFLQLITMHGSDAIYHRDESTVPCPCRTPEGYRDPEWHLLYPSDQCNEAGFLKNVVQFGVKAFIQPIQSTRAVRLSTEFIQEMFGTILADDHLGIFPYQWGSNTLNFYEWSSSGEDYIIYDGRWFTSVNSNLIPDPADGNPHHHWEVGLRLMSHMN